jgi:hypothetical protein
MQSRFDQKEEKPLIVSPTSSLRSEALAMKDEEFSELAGAHCRSACVPERV